MHALKFDVLVLQSASFNSVALVFASPDCLAQQTCLERSAASSCDPIDVQTGYTKKY